jgi:hypothetical protein
VQSVTRLVDAAGAGRLRDELRELREATERLALMAAAMTELELGRAPESPAGPGGGE